MNDGKNSQAPTLMQAIGSVGAAFLGVQSTRNRERDFEHGRPYQFILLGLGATLLFIISVWGVVSVVMSVATP